MDKMDINFKSDDSIIYSSDPSFSRKTQQKKKLVEIHTNLPIEIRREVKNRRGKPVITIRNVPADTSNLFLRELKKTCGAGGSNKNGVLEIQGDHREKIIQKLTNEGYKYKWIGG